MPVLSIDPHWAGSDSRARAVSLPGAGLHDDVAAASAIAAIGRLEFTLTRALPDAHAARTAVPSGYVEAGLQAPNYLHTALLVELPPTPCSKLGEARCCSSKHRVSTLSTNAWSFFLGSKRFFNGLVGSYSVQQRLCVQVRPADQPRRPSTGLLYPCSTQSTQRDCHAQLIRCYSRLLMSSL